MIEFVAVTSIDEIHVQRNQYMNELPYAQELNTEENIWECQYYKIKLHSVWVGYFCVSLDKTLWQFYLDRNAHFYSQEIFKNLIDMNYIIAAECVTYDHLFMSLCLDFHKKASCSAYVFRDYIDVEEPLSSFDNISFRKATNADYISLSEIGGDFFYDLDEHIRKEEVFMFFLDHELLGAGTLKNIYSGLNYYDLGMVVNEKHSVNAILTCPSSALTC